MAPNPRFIEGEKVLCFHGPLLYEAKCLKVKSEENVSKYYIHYFGWNKNWDEWVPECRVLKHNETNLQKQKQLQAMHTKNKRSGSRRSGIKRKSKMPDAKDEAEDEDSSCELSAANKAKKLCTATTKIVKKKDEKKSKLPSKVIPSTTSGAKVGTEVDEDVILLSEKPSKQKSVKSVSSASCYLLKQCTIVLAAPENLRKVEAKSSKSSVSFQEEEPPKIRPRINFPLVLKEWLTDDTDFINNQRKILRLPAKITVDHIIARYIKEKVSDKNLSSSREAAVIKLSNKIRDCFNVMLGKLLLYKFERPQYAELLYKYKGSSMSEIYGAIHFLRMLDQLEELDLSTSDECYDDLKRKTLSEMDDYARFLCEHESEFFAEDDYVVTTPEYQRQALS